MRVVNFENTDYLLLEDEDDLRLFWIARKVRVDKAFAHVMKKAVLNPKHPSLVSMAIADVSDQLVVMSTYGAKTILIAHEQLIALMREQYNKFKGALKLQNILISRQCSWQFMAPSITDMYTTVDEITDPLLCLNFMEDPIKTQKACENKPAYVSRSGEVHFVYIPADYRCVSGDGSHDKILEDNGYGYDVGLKLTYYTQAHRQHKLWGEYGIQGLRISSVYETEPDKEYVPNATDLRYISEFCSSCELLVH